MSMRDKLQGDLFSRMPRYPQRGWIAGVCAGLAEYFDWNVKVVRLVFALILICGGGFPMILIYCVLWYLMDPATGTAATLTATEHRRASDGQAPNPASLKARFADIEQRLSSMEECVVSKDFELRQELRKLES